MKYSKKDFKTAKNIFENSLREGKLDETKILTWASRLKRLGAKKGLRLLSALLKNVSDFYKKQTLVVESAEELRPGYLEDIKRAFETKLRKSLKLDFRKNKILLAGIKVTVGDTVWDYSVRESLDSLKEASRG